MGNFHTHADEPSKETRQKWAEEDLANKQATIDRHKGWIVENLDKMDYDQLRLIYDITEDVEDFRVFFEVLKKLK